MRYPLVPAALTAASLIALYACASGKATGDEVASGGSSSANGGSSSDKGGSASTTSAQGGTSGSQDSKTDSGQGGSSGSDKGSSSQQGGSSQPGSSSGSAKGGSSAVDGSSTKGGSSAIGGGSAKGGSSAVGGSSSSCTAPPTPVSTWKSFAACKATTTEMEKQYTSWKSSYYVECGTQAYIKATIKDGNYVVSEGIGYGMLLSAALNKSDDFSKLWAFYKARLNGNGVMGWKYPVACSGNALDSNAASDADVDAAMALIMAAKTFSNSSYLTDAKTLIGSIKKAETLTSCSGGKYALRASDGSWATCDDLNPSYFATGYYRIFGKVTSDSTFWDKMATDGLAMLAAWQSKLNGQVPDWGKSDGSLGGTSHSASTGTNGKYGADACRTPWRVAIDYGWNQSADAKKFLTTMYEGVLGELKPYIAVADNDDQHLSSFVGGYAMVGTGIDQTTADQYFQDFYYGHTLYDSAYYELTLRLLYLVAEGGRFDSGQ
jgi:endoglucanase